MMFGRSKEQHSDKRLDPTQGERSSARVAERTPTEVAPTTAGPFPVPRHLLDRLRNYPRLRDVVVGYLLVQDRVARYEEIVTDFDSAGDSPSKEFWNSLRKKLGSESLRADFPSSLLGDPEFERYVLEFDTEHGRARDAAAAGRNPFQSAQSAEVAYTAVSAMLEAAENLGTCCKAEARSLLEELHETVSKIFADEELLAAPVGTTERSTGASPAREPDSLAPTTERGVDEKEPTVSVSVPDVETHLLSKGEPT
jgi:hypothetical protein